MKKPTRLHLNVQLPQPQQPYPSAQLISIKEKLSPDVSNNPWDTKSFCLSPDRNQSISSNGSPYPREPQSRSRIASTTSTSSSNDVSSASFNQHTGGRNNINSCEAITFKFHECHNNGVIEDDDPVGFYWFNCLKNLLAQNKTPATCQMATFGIIVCVMVFIVIGAFVLSDKIENRDMNGQNKEVTQTKFKIGSSDNATGLPSTIKATLIPMNLRNHRRTTTFTKSLIETTPPQIIRTHNANHNNIQTMARQSTLAPLSYNTHSALISKFKITINSVKDFVKFSKFPRHNYDTLIVEMLVDDDAANINLYSDDTVRESDDGEAKYENENNSDEAIQSFKIEYPENIKTIKINGPITEKWLERLLVKFHYVEDLTINIDELCIGATVRDRDSLLVIKLENVQSLTLTNARVCSISTWIFTWEMPKILKLEVTNADLTARIAGPLQNFLEKYIKSIKSVIISNSYICPQCTFSNREFRKFGYVQILDRLNDPIMFQ